MLDTVIIGAGPAGIAAAIYAKRYNLTFMLLEKNLLPGGKIMYPHWIENYIGFPEGISGSGLADTFSKQLSNLGIKPDFFSCISIKKTINSFEILDQNHKIWNSKTVILAQGTEERMLGVPGEEKYKGLGVSYCATCDAPFFKGKTIATVGGGDSALSETLYLAEFAKQLFLIHRRDSLRGAEILGDKIHENTKIKPYFNYVLKEIIGNQYVEKIIISHVNSQEELTLTVDGIFIFAGYEPKTDFIEVPVTLDEKGFVITDENMETNIKGIYAAGDIRSKPLRQIITAVSDGAIAAHSVREFLRG